MKSHASLVSVVIPSYNKAEFLAEAIESVLQQTYQNFEIIVVDDGSKDNTMTVARSFAGVAVVQKENGGPSSARNSGLAVAVGEFIVFLDADDRLLPEALRQGLDSMETHPECAFVSGHVRLISKDSSHIRTPEESCIEQNHYRTMLHYNYIWTPAAVMFRKDVFHQVGNYSEARYGTEDWEMYLRITRQHPVHCHDKIIAEYRVYPGQLSSNSAHMLKESIATLRQQWVYVKGNQEYETAYLRGIHEVQKYFGDPLMVEIKENMRAREWMEAFRGMVVLLRYYPNKLFQRSPAQV